MNNNFSFSLQWWLLSLCITALCTVSHAAEQLMAEEIMQRVDRRDDGETMHSDMVLIIIDKSGRQRRRQLKYWQKDQGEDTLRLFFFLQPAEVRRTAFLSWDYRDSSRDDDQWLYLPALHRTKRIASGDKSDSFMGSDFSYADLSRFNVADYSYSLKEERIINAVKMWVIEALPKSEKVIRETGYRKILLLVRQDNYVVIRGIYWLTKRGRIKYMEVKKLHQIDGIWIAGEIDMMTRRGKTLEHRSVLVQENIVLNRELPADLFTVRQLEKGWR